MLVPNYLKKGDTIAIVATARKVQREELQEGIHCIQSYGFHVVLGASIGASDNQFAGDDSSRAADLQQFLDDPHIQAIWVARGGYGTVRIIDRLDFTHFFQKPKWIIGYSDVTVLHNTLHNIGWASLHAPLVFDLHKQPTLIQNQVFHALTGKDISYPIPVHAHNKPGQATGIFTGGNLSILYAMMGSATAVDYTGKILFIEDLDEYLYHIDRMILGLKRSGVFKNLAGLLVGGMTDMRDNTRSFGFKSDNPFGKTPQQIIREAVSDYDFPVCFDFPAGHISSNYPLIFGKKVTLEVTSQQVQLEILPTT
jgi:muramoyltetrapeptide carboxypeptidase